MPALPKLHDVVLILTVAGTAFVLGGLLLAGAAWLLQGHKTGRR